MEKQKLELKLKKINIALTETSDTESYQLLLKNKNELLKQLESQ